MEEDCSKHQKLIALINKGFTNEVSAGLGPKVSLEARLLVSRLLTVQPDLRIKVALLKSQNPIEERETLRRVKLPPAPGSPSPILNHLCTFWVSRWRFSLSSFCIQVYSDLHRS